MNHIILNEEQLQILGQVKGGAVEVRDPAGKLMGYLEFTSEQEIIEECKRRRESNEPTFTTEQVFDHLRALEEAANRGVNESELMELLETLQNEFKQ